MTSTRKIFLLSFGGLCLFFALFFTIAYWYTNRITQKDINQINTHAEIVALGVWNLDVDGIKTYLNLALQADDYEKFQIITDQQDVLLQVVHSPLKGVEKLLRKYHLIWTKQLSAPISYQGVQLGTLQSVKVVRIIFPLVNIFVFQFFIVLTGIFITYLSINRRLLEQEVEERTRRYHELVNLLPEMVLETDEQGRVVYANKIALARFGLDELETNAFFCSDFIHSSSSEQEYGDPFIPTADKEQAEYIARDADGSHFPVLIRSAQIIRNQQVAGARMVIVDITERAALEEQLRRDQKMKSIGVMAGGVAHDLNNILSGVVNYPELILMQLPEDSPLKKLVNPMKAAGLRAAAIVADLLTVARGIAASRAIADVNELVVDYTKSPEFQQFLSTHAGLAYEIQLHPEPCLIACSLIHVRKCLMNLCSNGVESMEGVGCLTITTAKQKLTEQEAQALRIVPGTYVTLAVCDQGKGISKEDLHRIFEPFYTKKKMGRSGTGIGLTVVWNTMQDHNGSIRVESANGQTVFTLYFPAKEDGVKETVKKDFLEGHNGNGESVLVIDDEPQQRDIASQLLASLGYTVTTAATGQKAIDHIREHRTDVLLLDMVMPGLSGLETYQQILQIWPKQRAVIASGFSASDEVKTAQALGAGTLINKPYTKEQLARAIYMELRR